MRLVHRDHRDMNTMNTRKKNRELRGWTNQVGGKIFIMRNKNYKKFNYLYASLAQYNSPLTINLSQHLSNHIEETYI